MESRIRTGSGFRAQGAVKRKTSNGNPDTTDWFRLEGSGSGNFRPGTDWEHRNGWHG